MSLRAAASVVMALGFVCVAPGRPDPQDFTDAARFPIVRKIEEPFSVRTVKGRIFADREQKVPLSAAVFEIAAGPTNNQLTRIATTDKLGRFRLDNVARGTYTFRATLPSFQSATGTVVVSKHAERHNQIRLVMPPDH